jgi:predicted acetyltransferase
MYYMYVKFDSRKQTKDANTAIQEFKGKERRSKQESNLTGAKVKIYKERQNTSFGKLDQTMP